MIHEKTAAATAADETKRIENEDKIIKQVPQLSVRDFTNENPSKSTGLLSVKPANEWIDEAKLRPIPEQLCDCLWYMYELCILFADSNVGKSILATQIAIDLAKRFKILFCDFELTDKQFEARYSDNYTNHYIFPDNFLRAEINPDADFEGFESFEDYLINSIEKIIIETDVRILIIDNITYLKNETDKAKNALPLMKQLKALKNKYNLSILVLAHTPKRDLSKPITQNDLGGSKMIMNFCDSSFAIGSSHVDKNLRYVKQIKERNTPKIYDSENVKIFQIEKQDNYLFMAFIGFGREREHLKQMTDKDRDNHKARSKELKQQGLSYRDIARELGIGTSTVHKYINS
jgi:KaiC/GvpD/RAD55 family RecA-like ATPase